MPFVFEEPSSRYIFENQPRFIIEDKPVLPKSRYVLEEPSRPTQEEYPWIAEAMPFGETKPTEEPAEIRAILPTIKELITTQIPGAKYLTEEGREEFKKKPLLPPKWGESKPIGEWLNPPTSKVAEISKEVTGAAEWGLFPSFMKGVGAIAKEVLPSKLVGVMTKERVLPWTKPKVGLMEEKPPVLPLAEKEVSKEAMPVSEKGVKELQPEAKIEGVKPEIKAESRYTNEITQLRELVKEGEPGKRFPTEIGEWTGFGSSYPNFMKNKGWTKDEVLKTIDKGIAGEKLGIRQQEIWDSVKTEAKDIYQEGIKSLQAERIKDIPTAELNIGDRIKVRGEVLNVTEKTPEKIIIEDGQKFELDPYFDVIKGKKIGLFPPKAEIPKPTEIKPEIPPVKKPLMEPTIRFDPHKEMAEAGTEAMVAKGIKRDPTKLMTEQLVEEWLTNPAKYEEIASKYGVSSKEFANMMREQASSWGRKLGELGLEAQRLGKEIPEIGEALAELEKIGRTPGAMDWLQSGWKKFSNVWRGTLVTQLSTAMRNAEVQAGRVGLNVFEEGLNAGLQKALGKPQTIHPLDGVDQLFRLFQRNKPLTERILKEFPKEYNRLFATYMSDVESAGKLGGTISKGVDILNTANRFQEYTIRRAVFMGKLDQGLKSQGMDLVKIIENNEIGKIPLDTIKSSINSALEFTFAEQPKWGTIGRKFTDFVTSMPGATFIMPFPRFLLNSLKFQFEYSPLGILKLLSPAERAAFSAGNMEVMSRAILGSAMFGAAYQIRNSEYAGEKWYELNVGGKTIDMRPYNPFVSYLFAADLVKKSREGTLYKLTSKDIAMGVFSSNLRAGTGLYALDKILDGITQTGDPDKTVNMIKQFGGEVASGFLTPLNQFKEFGSGLDDYVVREKRSEPFMGPIKEKIPIVEKGLPPLYSPTHEGPVTRELPAVRQATGLMMKEKNQFEKELDRLGFDYREILPSTGNPEADNLLARYMGIASQRVALPLMKTKSYMDLDDKVKGLFLKELVGEIRTSAREVAEEENPKLFAIIELEKTPRREKILIKEPLQKTIEILKRK